MTKYREIFQEMLEQNKELFDSFRELHDQYALNPEKWKKEFNEKGEEILALMRRYENRLCKHSEGSGFGKFTGNLAEKFHEEVRNLFPQIDNIGLSTSARPSRDGSAKPDFEIKRILLN
ncbi:MAG: hypothetical protein Q7S03_03620 [bacterium]|nr:hypothetical protein [bacterium]